VRRIGLIRELFVENDTPEEGSIGGHISLVRRRDDAAHQLTSGRIARSREENSKEERNREAHVKDLNLSNWKSKGP
jgi:hypothetical protein